MRCFKCDRPVEREYPEDERWRDAPAAGVRFTDSGSYGSKHDLTVLSLVVCDHCLDMGLLTGNAETRGHLA